jgi:hypothetical protein
MPTTTSNTGSKAVNPKVSPKTDEQIVNILEAFALLQQAGGL